MNLFDVYPLFDVTPVKASGSYIFDENGVRYLDFYGGHAVISVGHTHPHYVHRLKEQLDRMAFYSNSVKIPIQQQLADKLGHLSGYPDYALFLCNSGAEANENAIKLASFHTGRRKIISFRGAFHGRTSAAVEATDDLSIQAPVNQSGNVLLCEWENTDMLKSLMAAGDVAAVIIEGIQGVGGVQVPSSAMLQAIRSECDRIGALFICDEVQSGYGRTGRFFAHQHTDVKPDLITVAKGMGNGFPVAGVLIQPALQARHGLLGTTFGGNYLACAAALAVLEIMENESLMECATKTGAYIRNAISTLPGVREIRGAGLMIGVELEGPCAPVRSRLLKEHRIFTGSSSHINTLRILPALNIGTEEADEFLRAFAEVLEKEYVQA